MAARNKWMEVGGRGGNRAITFARKLSFSKVVNNENGGGVRNVANFHNRSRTVTIEVYLEFEHAVFI
jgi:hypothetical protein